MYELKKEKKLNKNIKTLINVLLVLFGLKLIYNYYGYSIVAINTLKLNNNQGYNLHNWTL